MARRYERSTLYQPPGVDSSKAQTSQMLSQALSGFTRQTVALGAALSADRGAQEGAMSTGAPQLKSKFTAYGRAYNNSAMRNYLIEQQADMETQIGRIELEAGNDPQAFVESAQEVRKGALDGLPAEIRPQLTELYSRRITEGVGRLSRAQMAEQKELARAQLNLGMKTLMDSISRKMTSGDPELMAQAEEEEVQLSLMIDGAVNSGDLPAADAVVLKQDSAKKVTTQIITGEFERQVQAGNALGFINRVMSQPIDNLDDDEKQSMVVDLFGRLNRWQSLQNEAAQTDAAVKKELYERSERQLTQLWMNSQLTHDILNQYNDAGLASPNTVQEFYTRLRENSDATSDPRTLALFQLNLLDETLTEDVIMERGDLSWSDKQKLIAEQRKQIADFADTEPGQEARRRISASFGGSDGFLIAFLEPDKAKQRGDALTLWWTWMNGLPPEKRDQNALQLAEDAIKRVQQVTGVEVDDAAVEIAAGEGVPDDQAREILQRLRRGQQ